MPRPAWNLPPGVSGGTWDYAQSASIAERYDEYHAQNPLFDFERQVIQEEFTPPGRVADLGCGSGRVILPLVEQGFDGLAVDLSAPMLQVVQQQAQQAGLEVQCLQANLVELDAIGDRSVDYALCLFSTLGMIHGRDQRRRALGHVHRILRPGGKLVLHVHNLWFNLRNPGGPAWVLKSLVKSYRQPDWEFGDKYYPYRGIPNFFLHVFRRRELAADLRAAHLHAARWTALDVQRRHPLRWTWIAQPLRANGWIVVCQRP